MGSGPSYTIADGELAGGNAISEAAIVANGGAGASMGGDAGWIEMEGANVTLGPVTANGGDADPTLAGSVGGYGMYVWLDSPDGADAITTSTFVSEPGTGETAGEDATYDIAGVCTGPWCY